ncbi:MAG TPA: tRNA (cytidine(34)-2'-O)-methyltransferase [Steroidobacteraceae bacterium]|jgi:tRNA (cytidine/uridine-2'-O-)-methyltransferase|nr:tRNA (cytidine(34)-2'-O)-methyltransferase [Steroidobacteraceae bacterium]
MFHVVLFEPEIPGNTGNVIRLCANSGARLHLVKPLGFRLDDKSLQRSGLDYHDLADVMVHADLGVCMRQLGAARLFMVETAGRRRYSDVEYRAGDAFLFGPETRGLPQSALDSAGHDNSVFIPMRAQNRSLNLSNAVALVVFEAWRQCGFARRQPE